MKLNEKIRITEERLNSDERSYERLIMAFLVGSYKAAPGYRMEVMSSRETGYDVFAVEVNVYMPRQKTAYATFYIELNSMNIQPAGTQNEPKMIYYRGTFEEYKENEYKAYCAAADFMGRMEQPAPETAAPDAPQEAANDETEADTMEQAATDNEQEETHVMKEYWFFELGYFQERDCKTIKEEMDGKTFMNFEVIYSNCHGNCSLGIKTDYDETEEKIKNFFLNCALGLIFELKHGDEEREKTRKQAEEFYRKRDEARQQSTQDNGPEAAAGQPAPQEGKPDMTNEERIDALFHELVPMEGKADTVAGEIVRAVCRIGYRYNNDGDYIGSGYGKETCNPAARYLIANAGENVAEIVRCLWAAGEKCGVLDDGSYDDWLSELVKATLAYLDERPELKTTPNVEGYWNYRDPVEDVDEWDDEDDEDEDEWDAA